MIQRAVGSVRLNNNDGGVDIAVEHENLYLRSVPASQRAMRGEGRPAPAARTVCAR
ncbi:MULTISPECIES: hypothetical protein [unclassified Janthinobacterium]|uniref:hypothetical protein n=1 Tax=unclassified Janthinobacterium TaxID=2610881 RepID=UPI0003790FFB|nr:MULTISPECIES: hypothetical protein [unclassified Janthinobacterium]MEC5164186.1 hypothetical protein [Janthinobacterium sp. CG_S6]